MNDVLDRVVKTRESAHEVARLAYTHAQTLIANGCRVRITCAEDQDDISAKQRRFLHGPVFRQISEQVVVEGTRYTTDIWKEYFRKRFLPDKFEMRSVPRWDATLCRLVPAKRPTPYRVRQSTEDLGIKGYSNYIDKVIDTAVLEFGVMFRFITTEREEVRWVAKPKAKKAEQPEELPC